MDQLIHIVLHHIPPVIPLEDEEGDNKSNEKSKYSRQNSKGAVLSKEEEIQQLQKKIAFIKELVMAQGNYRQSLLKSLKTAITMNSTFLILSTLSVWPNNVIAFQILVPDVEIIYTLIICSKFLFRNIWYNYN